MSEPTTEMIESFDGTRLALHRLGQGAPVLLLHGLFSDARTNWIRFGHAARIAAEGYECLMPDFRVHGDSEAPADDAAYPANVLIRDTETLIERLGLDAYDLCGFSLGARTALHGVVEGRFTPRRLIACGMGTAGLGAWSKRSAFFVRVIDRFDTIKPGDPEYFSRQFLKTQGIDRAAARKLLGTLEDMAMADLDRVTMPALVVCGDRDQDNGSGRDLAQRLPHARFVEVPGTHMSSVAKPELGEAIAGWLAA